MFKKDLYHLNYMTTKFTLNRNEQVLTCGSHLHSHSSKVAHQTAVCEWSPFSSDCNYAYCFAIG